MQGSTLFIVDGIYAQYASIIDECLNFVSLCSQMQSIYLIRRFCLQISSLAFEIVQYLDVSLVRSIMDCS